MSFALITTTINVPTLLTDYLADARENGHKEVKVFVAGDFKTPPETVKYCERLSRDSGYNVLYMGVDAQAQYLQSFPKLGSFLPWNSVQRRNVAILKAYEEGVDTIVTIDDDNYLNGRNYFANHEPVGQVTWIDIISTKSGWFNNCHFLQDKNEREFFARGYPVKERAQSDREFQTKRGKGKIVVNGGLWLGDPDIDAVTRLAAPIDVIAFTRNTTFALAPDTWCPFNSQNTALSREVIPSYFLSPHVGRFDDIWSSYVVKRIADHLGHLISFGHPLVQQNRNAHNLWHDLDLERMGMQLTESFCSALRQTNLSGTTYSECTEEIIEGLQRWIGNDKLLSEDYRNRLLLFVQGHLIWLSIVGK